MKRNILRWFGNIKMMMSEELKYMKKNENLNRRERPLGNRCRVITYVM